MAGSAFVFRLHGTPAVHYSDIRLPDPLKLALDAGVIIMQSISLAPDFPTAVGPAFTFVWKYYLEIAFRHHKLTFRAIDKAPIFSATFGDTELFPFAVDCTHEFVLGQFAVNCTRFYAAMLTACHGMRGMPICS